MQKKTDRRVRKTKTQLRNGLAMLMKEKSVGEITVKELVDQVDINRSTFYLHYPDISGLLYEIENDLAEEMERAIREHPIEKREDNGFYFLQDIFQLFCGQVIFQNFLHNTFGYFFPKHGNPKQPALTFSDSPRWITIFYLLFSLLHLVFAGR